MDGSFVGHIELEKENHSLSRKLLGSLHPAFRMTCSQQDRHPSLGQTPRNGFSDSLVRTSDECNGCFIDHRFIPFSFSEACELRHHPVETIGANIWPVGVFPTKCLVVP